MSRYANAPAVAEASRNSCGGSFRDNTTPDRDQAQFSISQNSVNPAGMHRACELCAYFHPYLGSSTGECRRYAPRGKFAAEGYDWPNTARLYWCGEFLASVGGAA